MKNKNVLFQNSSEKNAAALSCALTSSAMNGDIWLAPHCEGKFNTTVLAS